MDNYFKKLTIFRFFLLFFLFYAITALLGVYVFKNISDSIYMSLINVLFYIILYLLIIRIPLTKLDRKKITYNPRESNFNLLLLISPFFILNVSSAIYIQILNLIDSSLVDKYMESPNLTSNFEIYNDPIKIIIFFIVIVVLAPIIEELVFRGVLFNLLNKRINTLSSMILSSLFFGILHSKTFIPTAIIGFLICFIYQRTSNIRYSILAHMFNNFIAFLIPLLSKNINIDEVTTGFIAIIIIMLDLFFVFYIINYFRDNKEYFKFDSPLKRIIL